MKQKQDIFFLFFTCKKLKTIVRLFFLKLFPIIFFWWKTYSSPFIFIDKRFNFCYYICMFSYFSRFNTTVTAYWKHLLSLLLIRFVVAFFVFYPVKRIYNGLDLFYDIYNTINEHTQRQTHHLSLIPNYFNIYCWVNQKVFL